MVCVSVVKGDSVMSVGKAENWFELGVLIWVTPELEAVVSVEVSVLVGDPYFGLVAVVVYVVTCCYAGPADCDCVSDGDACVTADSAVGGLSSELLSVCDGRPSLRSKA